MVVSQRAGAHALEQVSNGLSQLISIFGVFVVVNQKEARLDADVYHRDKLVDVAVYDGWVGDFSDQVSQSQDQRYFELSSGVVEFVFEKRQELVDLIRQRLSNSLGYIARNSDYNSHDGGLVVKCQGVVDVRRKLVIERKEVLSSSDR